jgi:cell wall-associated NlpC family hydrolase
MTSPLNDNSPAGGPTSPSGTARRAERPRRALRALAVVMAFVMAGMATMAALVTTAAPVAAQSTMTGFGDPTGSGWDLGGGVPMVGMDPLAGALLGTDLTSMAAGSYNDVTDLVINDLIDTDALRAAQQARAELERRRRSAMAGQSEVGPDGCPVSAPPRGLQTRSEIDLNDVCARSVAQARNPETAKAIKYALTHLGNPYSQPKRNLEGWYDCSSFYSRAFEETGTPIISRGNGGWPQTTWSIGGPNAQAFWVQIPFGEARPGDAILTDSLGHVAMRLVDGLVAETVRDGDVSKIIESWFHSGYAAYLDPSRVP